MMKPLKAWAWSCAVALGAAAFAPARAADDFPSRPIRVIVPYAPGGGSDISIRVVQNRVQELLKQSLIVDNRAGGGTMIGTRLVAGAAPDGYTLGIMDPAFLANPLMTDAKYDATKDFVPVSLISVTPMIFAVPASEPVKSVKEFVDYVKAKPSVFNYGSPGSGSAGHLAIEQFRNTFGLKGVHIPYKGSGPAMAAIAGGEINSLMSGSALVPLVQDGRLRGLAVTGTKRLNSLPAVPTFAELGFPQVNVQTFAAMVAPAGTPRPVVLKLQAAFAGAVNSPDMKVQLDQRGAIPVGSSADELAAFFKDNTTNLAKVVQESNIKIE
ncbi:MAG TPA: tripartite tricarboxylate transporter substrate binding protein [Burkholderiales bacterium]|jgi:tripartite-type tricarboxylate transporter receptor subunit TctC|nr:tripartite tricarboxylate transporter substrate binding protein [Burkholderiales bacterium]